MLNIVFNPKACKGKAVKKLKAVELYLKEHSVEYQICETKTPRHAVTLTQELIAGGATNVIAMGGDGTVSEVLNGFSNFENVTMGIIPSGTGNDFIKSIGIPNDPIKALEIVLNCDAKYTDYLQLNNVRGINIVGTGIDVDILKRCKKAKVFKGKIQYVLSLIATLLKFKNYRLKASYNGKVEDHSSLIVCAGNGRVFGGSIPICPKAVCDDGYIDFVMADNVKKSKIPGAFIKLMKGKILEQPFTRFERTTELEVTSPDKLTVNVDGELYDNLEFKVTVVHDRLKIYRP